MLCAPFTPTSLLKPRKSSRLTERSAPKYQLEVSTGFTSPAARDVVGINYNEAFILIP